MTRKIRWVAESPVGPPEMTVERRSQTDLVQAAMYVGLAVGIVLFLIMMLFYVYFGLNPYFVLAGPIVVGVVVTAFLVAYRMTEYERNVRLETKRRQVTLAREGRAWEREELSWKREDLRWTDPVSAVAQEPVTQAEIDALAWVLLGRAERGLTTSRDACVAAGICSQKEWNLVNELLKARGIKDARAWRVATRGEGWALWCEGKAKARRMKPAGRDMIEAE